MQIAVGSDHRGVTMRQNVLDILRGLLYETIDVGAPDSTPVDYPDVAEQVASMVSNGTVDRGILICGTGIGMSIAANKFPGVRAAPVQDEMLADISRRHNDLNVLCLPADMMSTYTLERVVKKWLETEFDGGRHARRIEKIAEIERKNGMRK
ncbi:MAG: ribose 5-phosphate isomerase B [Thermoguttaceae bacterium]|nr:ribose 5-phosphate isomerase B [Thermoguttaceae bacterium]